MAEGLEDNLQIRGDQDAEGSVSSDVLNLDGQTLGQQYVADGQIVSAVENQVSSPSKTKPRPHPYSKGLCLLQGTKRGETRGTRLPRPKHPGAIPKKRPSLPPHGSEPEVSSERLTAELRMLQTVSGLDQGENSKVEFPEPLSSPSCGERPPGCLPRPKGDPQKGDTSSNRVSSPSKMKTRSPRPKHHGAIPKKRPSLPPRGSEPEVSSEQLTAELRMLQTVSGLDQGENSKLELPESFSSPSCGERPPGCLPRQKGDLLKCDTSSDQVSSPFKMKTRLPRPKHPGAIPKKRPSLPPHGSEPEVSSERLTAELQMLQTVSGLDQGENSKVELPESFSSPSCGERPPGCLPRPKGDLHKGDTSSDQVSSPSMMKMRLPRPKHPGAIPKKRPSQPPHGPKLEVSSEQLTGELQMVQTVTGLDQGENSMVEFPEPFSSLSCGERPSESLHPPRGDLQKGDTSSNEGQIYGSSYCSDTTAVPIAAVDERGCLPAENIDATVTNGETAVCKNSKVPSNYETPSDFRLPPETDLPVAQRPPTPEGHQSLQSSLVTGHQSCKTSVAVVACKGKRGQQRGNPAEHDDVIRNDGLLQKIQKENELLYLNEMFLVQDLRVKSSECSELRAENNFLKQELQASRAECTALQQQYEELRDEGVSMMAENLQTIRQIEELYQQKSQEFDRLRERLDAHPMPPFLEPDDD